MVKLIIGDYVSGRVFDATYDAWGRQTVTLNTIGLRRGYTGHEMMGEFGLINMNGRVYDPTLGRFLSPDNYVQAPDNSQSFNRYSYCLNNPLKYTDPSGEFWNLIIGRLLEEFSIGPHTDSSLMRRDLAISPLVLSLELSVQDWRQE